MKAILLAVFTVLSMSSAFAKYEVVTLFDANDYFETNDARFEPEKARLCTDDEMATIKKNAVEKAMQACKATGRQNCVVESVVIDYNSIFEDMDCNRKLVSGMCRASARIQGMFGDFMQLPLTPVAKFDAKSKMVVAKDRSYCNENERDKAKQMAFDLALKSCVNAGFTANLCAVEFLYDETVLSDWDGKTPGGCKGVAHLIGYQQ